jgi:hypothetical protein
VVMKGRENMYRGVGKEVKVEVGDEVVKVGAKCGGGMVSTCVGFGGFVG